MKKIQQNGFGTIEGLLVLVILLLVGFIGYYVQHAKSEANTNLKQSLETQTVTNKQKPAAATAGTRQYVDASSGFSVNYPVGWVVHDYGTGPGVRGPVTSIAFTSADYVTRERFGLASGGDFMINHEAAKASLKDYVAMATKDGMLTNAKDVQFQGVQAVKGDCWGPENALCLQFVKDGLYWQISYDFSQKETHATAKYRTEFNNFIASFKLK